MSEKEDYITVATMPTLENSQNRNWKKAIY